MAPWALPAVVLGGLTLSAVVHVAVCLGLARFARVRFFRAVLGAGPYLGSFVVGGATVEVRLLPFTSYVQALGMAPHSDDRPPAAPRLLWLDAPAWRRAAAFALAPRVATFLPVLAILGGARAIGALTDGLIEVFAGFSGGRPSLDAAAAVLAREGVGVLFGLGVCKLLALGIWVLPVDLARTLATRRTEVLNRPLASVQALVMLGFVVVGVAWLVTWLRWAL